MLEYLKTATILYVEDQQEVREGYQKPLTRYSKELFVAINGEDGYQKYIEHRPDIVVTDIKMPIMDGLEMIKKIKAIDPKQIIIITSAHSDSDYFMEAISLQVDGYILKPVDKNILKEKIEHFSKQLLLESEIEKKNQMLNQKEKLASMGEMIGNIAHQWRQPLSVISTSASGLQIEKENNILSDESFNNYLDIIIKNTDKLSATIDEFKSFIEYDKEPVKFNISKMVKRCFEFEDQGIVNNNIEVIYNLDDSLEINNFPNNFIQSLVNIINNSIDILTTKDIDKRFIFVSLFLENDQVVLYIKDSGGGIDEKILPKIFEAYTTTKHKYVGTGLGMYSSYNIIVNEMKSMIEVQNKEYHHKDFNLKGAQFKITLNNYE